MVRFRHSGNFAHTERFFARVKRRAYLRVLDKYGQAGVQALSDATPKRSGETARAWSYSVEQTRGGYALYFCNDHVNKGVNIAVILQCGHGTGTGGYVRGIDYINPAIRPIFETIAQEAWKEVTGR